MGRKRKDWASPEIDPKRPQGFPPSPTLTILYDNTPFDPRLRCAWGFSCLVEWNGKPSFSIRAKALITVEIYLVMGGYRLFSAHEWEIIKVIESFKESGVEWVCPCHCTGDSAMGLFRESHGEQFIAGGVGRVIRGTG